MLTRRRSKLSSRTGAGGTALRGLVLRLCALLLLPAATLGASCGQSGLAILPGVVNDPANRTLRRELFSFALSQLCPEMLKRTMPLRLRDDDPNIGRFFPLGCVVRELDNGNLFVQFAGHGYAWTSITQRLGFEAGATMIYEHDFMLEGSSMYVYFRQVEAQSQSFQPKMVERGDGGSAGGVAGLFGATMQQAITQIGSRILQAQLARGFTVIRQSDGSVQLSLGIKPPGEKPLVPFARGDSDWELLANDRCELHLQQRDFAGPFEIPDDDSAIYLTMLLEGAPAVDVLVVPKQLGDAWIHAYEHQPVTTPPPGPPVLDEAAPAGVAAPGQPPTLWRRMVRAPKGLYYIVFDNTATAGRTEPPQAQLDDRAAHISYAVQLGEAP